VYPPYLGHANFLAEINFVGVFEGKLLPIGIYELNGIIPATALQDENDILYNSGGLSIVFLCLFFLGYAYFGNYFPELIATKGFSIERISSMMYLTLSGIYGIPPAPQRKASQCPRKPF
jgi:hypothetical protein